MAQEACLSLFDLDSNLDKSLKEIFNKYAKATEGKSTEIIDIYGSRNGERDGITSHQEDLLEGLCNATDTTLGKMFKDEHKALGVSVTDVSEVREVGGVSVKRSIYPKKDSHPLPDCTLCDCNFAQCIRISCPTGPHH